MSFKTPIFSDKAPKAIGPYSPAICIDGLVLFSGMLPVDPATGALAGEGITVQTKQSLDNICAVLEDAELTLDNVVRTTVFLADIKDFAAMNAVYGEYFKAPYPARSCFQVAALPMGAKVEIEVTCARGTINANEEDCGCCE